MIHDYSIVSPSLDGILRHESISYGGINRPSEILRVFDRPISEQIRELNDPRKRQVLEEYFHDMYGLFMRKFSAFITDLETSQADELKLQALLQELMKVKRLLGAGK